MNRPGSDVMLAVPSKGAVPVASLNRLIQLALTAPGLAVTYQTDHLGIAAGRNAIAETFLESDRKVLVMVDDDVLPTVSLLDICDLLPEYGVVSQLNLMPPLDSLSQGGQSVPIPAGHGCPEKRLLYNAFDRDRWLRLVVAAYPGSPGVHEHAAVGFGAVAISREAIVTIGPSPFRQEGGWCEDIIFCVEATARGFKIGGLWGSPADHVTRVSLEETQRYFCE